jgi:hypothetical protein
MYVMNTALVTGWNPMEIMWNREKVTWVCSRCHESDYKLTDKIEINGFISLLSLGGVLWSNKKNLEEMWGTDGDDNEKFFLVMNHSCFPKFLILCFLE